MKSLGIAFTALALAACAMPPAETGLTSTQSNASANTSSATTSGSAQNAFGSVSPTSARSAGPVQSSGPIVLNGSGNSHTSTFSLHAGAVLVKTHYVNKDNNINGGLDYADGGTVREVIDGDGNQDDYEMAHVPSDGQYFIDVAASAPWSITFTQPDGSNPSNSSSFAGKDTDYIGPVSISAGSKTFVSTYTGDGEYFVTLFDKDGNQVDGVGSNIRNPEFKKTEQLSGGIYYLTVWTVGPWKIQIQ